jgi:hypothetical protein
MIVEAFETLTARANAGAAFTAMSHRTPVPARGTSNFRKLMAAGVTLARFES